MSDYVRAIIAIASASFIVTLGIGGHFLPIYRQAKALEAIKDKLELINQAIALQTAQHSWLVSHYAKPVRPIYPWEKHRCEWCGHEKLEGDDE